MASGFILNFEKRFRTLLNWFNCVLNVVQRTSNIFINIFYFLCELQKRRALVLTPMYFQKIVLNMFTHVQNIPPGVVLNMG
jgi:hypothetical protein